MNKLAIAFLLLFGLPLLGAGCGSTTGLDVDLADFEQIPGLSAIDYSSVAPGADYDYWEYRKAYERRRYDFIGSAGPLGREEIDTDLLAVFDSAFPAHGFGYACLPGDCYYYVASLRGDTIETWTGAEGFRSFLGAIDTAEDAILLARAHDYHWGADKSTAAVRSVAGGYELVVLKLVEFCDPVQVNIYLLHVSTSGALSERRSAVWEREAGVCI